MTNSKLLFVHTLSPLHCGTGQSIGAVDLPIAREVTTALPIIPGSGFKGALRSKAMDLLGAHDKTIKAVFGPETSEANEHAGALSFGDARLLCLPVRSLRGTFAWVTSPLLLSRLKQDCLATGITPPSVPHLSELLTAVDRAYVCPESALRPQGEKSLYFEDLDLKLDPSGELGQVASWLSEKLFGDELLEWREMFRKRLCLVSDDILMFFAQHSMELTTRVALDHDTKTVKKGQLWTEETLPSESILVSLCTITAGRLHGVQREQVWAHLGVLQQGAVQIGGNATVGQGRCRLMIGGQA